MPPEGRKEGAVRCLKSGCPVTWPRDPVLEVVCPTCSAPIGQKCRRPSGHRVFGGEPHPERDILADRSGHYGACPSKRCGLDNLNRKNSKRKKP
jgi:hypothetical protein